MCPFSLHNLPNIISPLTTLIAAFLGAWFAFLLQSRKEKRNEENANVGALNKVQINLVQQLNALTIFNRDFVQPYKDHPVVWIAIPAAPHRDYSKLQIDAGSLSFLIENNYSTLISKTLVVEEKFKEVINIINLRSKVHVGRLQPRLEEVGFKEGEPFDASTEEVEKMLGVRLVGELTRLTDGLISLTEDAIKSHEEIIQEIKNAGSEIFPNKRVLSFEYQDHE
jgi:predicted lactoylglutathione lyase